METDRVVSSFILVYAKKDGRLHIAHPKSDFTTCGEDVIAKIKKPRKFLWCKKCQTMYHSRQP